MDRGEGAASSRKKKKRRNKRPKPHKSKVQGAWGGGAAASGSGRRERRRRPKGSASGSEHKHKHKHKQALAVAPPLPGMVTADGRSKFPVHVVWFKATDMRLDDHLPLLQAHRQARQGGAAVLHLLTLDSTWFGPGAPRSREAGLPRVGSLRGRFVLEAAADLEARVRTVLGHQLLTFCGPSAEAFRAVGQAYQIRAVHAHGPEVLGKGSRVTCGCRNMIDI